METEERLQQEQEVSSKDSSCSGGDASWCSSPGMTPAEVLTRLLTGRPTAMAGAVMGNLSSGKLACLFATLLLTLLVSFLLGGLVAPEPSSSQSVLATICVDRQHEPRRWHQVWSVVGGQGMCGKAESIADLMDTGISSDQVVFAFQLPLRRGRVLDFTRWQQNLIGVLQLDIEYDVQYEMLPNATLALDVRLGYKNRGDQTDEWTLLASSVEERHLSCELNPEHAYHYNCDLIPLFELGSLHHDYYLVNLRLPPNMENQRNVGIGKLLDINLVVIFQNGGFTKVWVSLKAVFFPLVVALLIWFWRRVRALQRETALIEYILFALGVCLSVLNMPLEYLTLHFDMPYMPLITDIRVDIFYGVLLSFWLVFAGEKFTICCGSRLSAYWKHLCVVAFGCVSLVSFDMLERSVQLTNPFHSIWGMDGVADIALGFIIYICVLAGLYLCLLSWMIWRVFCVAKQRSISAISSKNSLQHHNSSIYCSKFAMLVSLATLTCAALTVVSFILVQLTEGRWKWNTDNMFIYMSPLLTGVYGMWNVYTIAVIFLYAPA